MKRKKERVARVQGWVDESGKGEEWAWWRRESERVRCKLGSKSERGSERTVATIWKRRKRKVRWGCPGKSRGAERKR